MPVFGSTLVGWGHPNCGACVGIGAELARARNAAGLTHVELAEKTRIRAAIIQAIERDDFSLCGGEVFARGHVKSIATALGLDPAPLLSALGAVQSATTFAQEDADNLNIWELQERTRTPSEKRIRAALIVVGVIVIGAFVYFARQSTATPELVPSAEPSASASPTVTPSVTVAPSATVAPTETPIGVPEPTPPQETVPSAVDGAIVLELECVSSSWVRITNDLGTLFEGTMRTGETRVLSSDTDVQVRIGNAAGIRLTHNGKTYYNLGQPGEVYTHTFRVD